MITTEREREKREDWRTSCIHVNSLFNLNNGVLIIEQFPNAVIVV